MTTANTFIPALKYNWLTRFYDFLIQTFLKEKKWKSFLIESISSKNPQFVLDIGTGTATLPMLMNAYFPQAKITGLDGDEKILSIAKEKIKERDLNIQLVQGMSFDLPFPDGHFDVVTSSLMLHHLSDEDKLKTFKEVLRVLKPSGEFMIADWGKPQNTLMRFLFYWVQFLDGFKTTTSNVQGLLPKFLSRSGFALVRDLKSFQTVGGSISIYKATKQ